MNGFIDIRQIVDVVLHTRQLLGIRQESFHLLLRTPIPEFEVIEHGIVLLRKTLVCILQILHIGSHLVGVVRHVNQGSVGYFRRFGCITATGSNQTSRKAGGLFHVFVGTQTGSPESIFGILLHLPGTAFEQRLNATDGLLQLGPFTDC